MKTKDKVIKLRKEGKSYKEISNELNISKATVSYHCQRYGVNDIGLGSTIIDDEKIVELREYYKTHTAKETAEKFNIGKTSVHNYTTNKVVVMTKKEKNEKNVLRVGEWRRNMKLKAVEYKGGECVECGYNKCVRSMDFHHINPLEKDFGFSGNIKSWDKIVEELDKCILVCSNCHGEIHFEIEENKRKEREEERIKNIEKYKVV